MRLGWGHVSHLTIRRYNFLRYTSADVDDAPVCLSADETPGLTIPDVNRWLEDAIAAFRAFVSLFRLLLAGSTTLAKLGETRKGLHERVRELSMKSMQLPGNPEDHFSSSGGKHKGRVGSTTWESSTKYFSLRRRRKRDWNETLRLYDVVDFPQIDNSD
jgi:hypothetical protein